MKIKMNTPLLQFILVGVAIYGLYLLVLPAPKDTIVVQQQTLNELIRAEENVTMLPLDEKSKNSVVENHIEEEVLLKEAYKRGFHLTDYRVRKQLLNLMRSSLTDQVPDPSYAQLKAFYEENLTKYLTDTSYTVQFVFFNFNSKQTPQNPEQFKNKLQSAINPLALSEYSPYGNLIQKGEFRRMSLEHGREFADSVHSGQLNSWMGPIIAKNGIEYIKLVEKHAPDTLQFEIIESYLRSDYFVTKSRQMQAEKIKVLMDQYTIEIEELNAN